MYLHFARFLSPECIMLYNLSNHENTIAAEVSPAVIGCLQRVSSRTILLSRKKEERFRTEKERSLLTAEITPRPLTSLNTFHFLIESVQHRILLFGRSRSNQGTSQLNYSLSREGAGLVCSLQVTCGSELFQVWNMAATETQLMLSVGLIGKFQFTGRFFIFYFFSVGFQAKLAPQYV